jgi:hypothetical protein
MPSKPFIDGRWGTVDVLRRPWPSLWRYCPGASKGGHYIGTYGRPPMSPRLRCGALLKRGPRVRSSWSRSGSFNGTPRPGVAESYRSKAISKKDSTFYYGVVRSLHFTAMCCGLWSDALQGHKRDHPPPPRPRPISPKRPRGGRARPQVAPQADPQPRGRPPREKTKSQGRGRGTKYLL